MFFLLNFWAAVWWSKFAAALTIFRSLASQGLWPRLQGRWMRETSSGGAQWISDQEKWWRVGLWSNSWMISLLKSSNSWNPSSWSDNLLLKSNCLGLVAKHSRTDATRQHFVQVVREGFHIILASGARSMAGAHSVSRWTTVSGCVWMLLKLYYNILFISCCAWFS